MLRKLAVAAMFALSLPGLALAQDRDHHDEHHGPPPHGAPQHGPPPHGPPPGARPFVAPHGMPPHGPPHGPMAGPMAHPGGPPPGAQFSYHGHPINRMHVSPFVYPHGWGYRRWEGGGVVPPWLLARNYWFSDWASLGVPPPVPGEAWVRYGPDLLLVVLDTGRVVEVLHDVFY